MIADRSGLADYHLTFARLRKLRTGTLADIAARPRGDDSSRILRIVGTRKQVIGVIQRDEALGMFGGQEQTTRVVDPYGVVGWRMKNQEALLQVTQPRLKVLRGNVVKELFADEKPAPGDRDSCFAGALDFIRFLGDQVPNVG